jgi:hypothetical protein
VTGDLVGLRAVLPRTRSPIDTTQVEAEQPVDEARVYVDLVGMHLGHQHVATARR